MDSKRGQGGGEQNTERRRNNAGRDQRMLASIQSVLSGRPSNRNGLVTKSARNKQKVEEQVEEIPNIDALIEQVSDLNMRSERSATQIARNISASKLLVDMEEDEWDRFIDSLISTAIHDSETDFVVSLFVPLMEFELFCSTMSQKLMTMCSSYIMDGEDDSDAIPAFLGSILCANWPRTISKAIDTVNPVLFDAVSIIKGWILVLTEDNEACRNEDDGVQDPDREEPEIVNRCAKAIHSLCATAQRSLWMKWPDICDEVYAAIKPAITYNTSLSGNVKDLLLHTLISLHLWTKTRSTTTKSVSTQTISRS